MIINLKYHIASLVAVFLALGLGILVGSAVLGNDVNDVIVQQQNKMFEKLKSDLDQMRKDNKSAQEEIATYKSSLNISKQFEKQMLPLLVAKKLAGKQIVIIKTNNYGFHEDWINTLKIAGARIPSITTVLEGFDLENKETRQRIATKLMLANSSESAVGKEISRELGVGITSAQNVENLHYFEQLGLIKTAGDYGVPVNAVVFVGGSQADPGGRYLNLDLPLMNYFLAQNIPVYGVETSDVDYSYMKQYQKLNVSTVDNIDMIPGQLSLVMAVYGKPGNYGIKTTARQLMPVVP